MTFPSLTDNAILTSKEATEMCAERSSGSQTDTVPSKVRENSRGDLRPKMRPGDRILVQAIVAEVHDFPTNWPIRIVLDNGASETIDNSGSVHFSALRSAPAEQDGGWLPIETAPKDGTKIWLGHPKATSRIGFWSGSWWKDSARSETASLERPGQDGLLFVPTHYQPLPAPPRSLASGSDGGVS